MIARGLINSARMVLRDYLAGGDASRWHYDEATDRMRRWVNGEWQSRPPDVAEQNAQNRSVAW